MDRGQRQACLLIFAAALLIGAAAARQLPIREARWLQLPDMLADLTQQPAECLAWPKDRHLRREVAMGRALFRSPLLLGGQAARVGLSCASCHRNGRTNPHFHFPGVSGAPGTADVTASIMSEKRGDDIFNPKPIPDLGGDPNKLKVKGTARLRDFIHGLIVEEFTGPEPSPAALDLVVAYVQRALAQSMRGRASADHVGGRSSTASIRRQPCRKLRMWPATRQRAAICSAAARSTLGAIDERFQLAGLDQRASTDLREADAELFRLQEGGSGLARTWKRDWPRRKRVLRAVGSRSLFNPDVLQAGIAS